MFYFDTETCGFCGPIVLIQYAVDDGPITLHPVWHSEISETLAIIEDMCRHEDGICGFNLTFDWFHICQTYTTLTLLAKKVGASAYPIDHIDHYAECEDQARDLDVCIKPVKALDLMVIARRGHYQSMMNRGAIYIKKIPTVAADILRQELDQRIPLKDIYFAKSTNPARHWRVMDRTLADGEPDYQFSDVVLKFEPSSALKALTQDALGLKDVLFMSDVEIDPKFQPKEIPYAPFAKAIGKPGSWKWSWPDVIHHHAAHWGWHTVARRYAEDDVKYTRWMHYFFSHVAQGSSESDARELTLKNQTPEIMIPGGDDDSELTCMVGAVRWRGYKIDIPKMQGLKERYSDVRKKSKWNFNSSSVVRNYLYEVMSDTERQALLDDEDHFHADRIRLEGLAKWKVSDVCNTCYGMGCDLCTDGLVETDVPHPAAERAEEILNYRRAGKRLEFIDKLLLAGRFHASFKVVGTLSSRMAGDDKLNAQGIPHEEEFRSCFPLAWAGLELEGGDFSGFEVSLADAVYKDPLLHEELLSGRKIHALFGQYLFPGKSYDDIMATSKLSGEKNLYGRSKNGVFALLYGGEAFTLQTRVGIPESVANEAYHRWCERYKVWGEYRKEIFNKFCSMRQPGGIGTKVEFHEACDYAESQLGFRRYFTLENRIVKALYDLASDLPKAFLKLKAKVTRRDREQTQAGAIRSALYAAAFSLQAANMRAAANHEIQSTGAELAKRLQRRLWEVQSPGVGVWRVQPMNIHDEIMVPTRPELRARVEGIVISFVKEYTDMVPLLEIEWSSNIANWSEK